MVSLQDSGWKPTLFVMAFTWIVCVLTIGYVGTAVRIFKKGERPVRIRDVNRPYAQRTLHLS